MIGLVYVIMHGNPLYNISQSSVKGAANRNQAIYADLQKTEIMQSLLEDICKLNNKFLEISLTFSIFLHLCKFV